MAEHWIPASKALELAGTGIALCTRLHAGLAVARAQVFLIDGQPQAQSFIPKEFWWATGHDALEQNWQSGDFATWINRSRYWQAFGVTIALSGLLEMVDFERRAILARGLSVASNPAWMSAKEARQTVYTEGGYNPAIAGIALLQQARLGFVSGRAVQATCMASSRHSNALRWEEREWDIPEWFWRKFTGTNESAEQWEPGKFRGKGDAPEGYCTVTLEGVYFHRESVALMVGTTATPTQAERPARGRKREYDWEVAVSGIWGQIYRGDFRPENQAQIEKALQSALQNGDKEPSESTVRPYASRIWNELAKA